jgi:SAM-dependent MidA family methyltransferase
VLRTASDEPLAPVTGLGPIVTSLAELPAVVFDGVVLANELLDNLPFAVVEWGGDAWLEVRIGIGDGGLVEVLVPASPDLAVEADRVGAGATPALGARLPVPVATADWLVRVGEVLRRGYLAVIDYADAAASLLARGQDGWLRTYRRHERGGPPLAEPGRQDVTADVPVEHLVTMAERAGFRLHTYTTQREWLTALGIEEIADAGAQTWRERASVGDLEAVAARSRVHEADALTDPTGLGAHHVFVFEKGAPG